jgi:hypothetical protein
MGDSVCERSSGRSWRRSGVKYALSGFYRFPAATKKVSASHQETLAAYTAFQKPDPPATAAVFCQRLGIGRNDGSLDHRQIDSQVWLDDEISMKRVKARKRWITLINGYELYLAPGLEA